MRKSFQSKPHFIEGAKYPLSANAQLEPPIPCELVVGDVVTYTNEYGAQFHNRLVTGFSPTIEHGRFVYFDTDAWWFTEDPLRLKKNAPTNQISEQPRG
jgi:hypothetical protein